MTDIQSQPDDGNGNLLVAQQATLAQAATVQSLSFYVTQAAGRLRLGVYDASGPSGGPGTKLAETAEWAAVVGWNTRPVLTPVTLAPGSYWLAYFPSDNNLAFVKTALGQGGRYYSLTYGALPATFSPTPSSTPSQWSFYATLNPTGVAAPAPTCAVPSSPSPPNGSSNRNINQSLAWVGSAGCTYTVKLGTTATPATVATNVASSSYSPSTLAHRTRYFWQIVAIDGAGTTTAGPVWSFKTR